MEKQTAKQILILTCLSYLALGVMSAALGPMLNQLAENNGVTLATIGGIYTALFLGALLSQLVLGPLTDKWGQMRGLILGCLLDALAVAAVTLSRWLPLTFALIFLMGIGYGMANLCGNVMIGRIFKGNSVSAVNWINVFYGVGAFVGPLLVGVSLFAWKTGAPAIWFGSLLMILAVALLYARFFNIQFGSQKENSGDTPHKRIKFSAFLWTLGIMVLIYVGTETAVGGWTTTYMQKTTSLNIEQAALTTAVFWLALTVGRLMGALIGSKISAVNVLRICLGISAVGAVLFVASFGHTVLSIISIFLMGWGFGAIYPTSMAMMTNAYPDTPGQAGALITSMSSVGGALIPWVQGITLEQLGMRAGTFFVMLLVALFISAFGVNQWVRKIKSA